MIAGMVGMEFNFSKRERITSLAFRPSDDNAVVFCAPLVEFRYSVPRLTHLPHASGRSNQNRNDRGVISQPKGTTR
jgi:hypothetical protein